MTKPYELSGQVRTGPWVVTCDHASNRVPAEIGGGSLGLPAAEMARHIAFDPGAEGVARALSETLDAPCVLSRFSRLVIDPNRGEDDPTLLMKLYDGTIIPGNRHAGPDERQRRLDRYYRPYHACLAEQTARPGVAMIAVHSFTARLRGRSSRPWQVGILSAWDRRLADPLIRLMAQDADFGAFVLERSGAPLCIGDNQPYPGHLPGDAVDRHALAHGRPNVLIELRQDLIATPEAQAAWAGQIGRLLRLARSHAGL